MILELPEMQAPELAHIFEERRDRLHPVVHVCKIADVCDINTMEAKPLTFYNIYSQHERKAARNSQP